MTRITDQTGALTLDFLFSMTLVFGLTLMLFALCLTLSVVEVTQYVTFAVARNYYAGHVSRDRQTAQANAKFDQLYNQTPAISSLYKNGWFVLSNLEVGPEADQRFFNEYPRSDEDRDTFVGARIGLNAKVLEIRIPFFGNTFDDEDGFTMRVASFLAREPNDTECSGFDAQRFEALRALSSRYQAVPAQGYFRITDNGCGK